jgi:inosine-uridine nucleoside N-ribohydrolase
MKEKILLDTDLGSDIDDSVCIAYLLAQPSCELLGITTVSGESEKRAMMASALCKVAQKDIPIYAGAEKPLFIEQRQKYAQQAKKLDKWEHDTHFPKGEAIEFLRQTIRKYPGEVTLLAIGPLTNIALLFSIDEEIPKLLKQLVIMGGVFTDNSGINGFLEWNIMLDPHAASIVYNSPVKIFKSVGLDVTRKVTMDAKTVKQRFNTKLLEPVLDFAHVWFEERDRITFHDPLAAVTIFNNDICTFKNGKVEVELLSERLSGLTFWKEDSNGNHEVALQVDQKKFFDEYFKVFDNY